MPRPRFARLPAAKKERIMEAAAKEFAAHGYEGATLNRILAEAGISKGAAYYYFDDKADLYLTALLHYGHEMLDGLTLDPANFTAANFWTEMTAIYQYQFTSFQERPWVLGLIKGGGAMSPTAATEGPFAAIFAAARDSLRQLIRHGQALGVIRRDLPEALLIDFVMALDDAHDRWLFAHWDGLTTADLTQAAERIIDSLRRLLIVEAS